MSIDWKPLKEIIDSHESFIITSHCRADCDALGSELALCEVLRQLGKEARIVNGDEVPLHIRFIDPQSHIEVLGTGVTAEQVHAAQVLFVVDTSAWGQLGPMADVVRSFPGTRIVIDHHVSEDDMRAIVFKNSSAEATGRLILELAEFLEVDITLEMANVLFCAIATDTGWFRFNSVTEQTFLALARLVRAGASPPVLFAALYEQHTLSRLLLRARMLGNIEALAGGKLIVTQVTRQDFEETGAQKEDTEDVINTLLTIAGSEVAVLFVELKEELTKVSLRSRSDFDVREVAAQFGGGGHRAAAGIAFAGTMEQARNAVLDALESALG